MYVRGVLVAGEVGSWDKLFFVDTVLKRHNEEL
jgi:hypothetical protein